MSLTKAAYRLLERSDETIPKLPMHGLANMVADLEAARQRQLRERSA
jgi:hypothetical protein